MLVCAQANGLERAKVHFDHWRMLLFWGQVAWPETAELLVMALGTLHVIASLALLSLLVAYDSIITIRLRTLVEIRGLVHTLVGCSLCSSVLSPG